MNQIVFYVSHIPLESRPFDLNGTIEPFCVNDKTPMIVGQKDAGKEGFCSGAAIHWIFFQVWKNFELLLVGQIFKVTVFDFDKRLSSVVCETE